MTTLPFHNGAAGPLAITLRPYQQAAVDGLYAWFEADRGNPLIVVPTGGGKSLIIAAFVHSALSQWPDQRILILTHVKELIEQNYKQLLRCWPTAPAGIYSAGLGRREHDARVLFAGIQSTYSKAAKIGWADLVIIDECHLIPKSGMGMYRTLLQDLQSMNPALKVIGLTATPFRTGEGSLDSGEDRLFDGVAYDCDLVQLIRDGYLSPVTAKGTDATIDTSQLHVRMGEFVESEMAKAAMAGDTVQRACREIASRGTDRRAWLIFCCSIEHAEAVAAEVKALGVSCATVFGDTPKEERARVVAAFRAGELRCVVNVNVLTTGFDAPHVDLIALLRPTMSPGLYCLDSETEILTSHGWRGVGKVAVGDCAMAMDLATGKGVWSPVLGYVERPLSADEKWVSYEAPRANFRVTNKHRLLFRREHDAPWLFGEAESVADLRDGVYMPTAVCIDQPGVPLTDAEIYLVGILMTDGTITPFQGTIYQSERYPAVMERIEKALNSAGIAYKKTRQICATAFVEGYHRWRYSISAGDPRNGRAGKGLRYLFPWLDKDLAPALFSMSRRQFGLLVDAMWDGDGAKMANVDYVPQSKMICTSRQVVADRLQALAAMHGYTAHMRWEHKGRKRPIAFVTFTDKAWRSIGGVGDRPQMQVDAPTDERVWCVETGHGTIVTRRHGKVTVMGNCQMVGRGLRLAEGKANCLVLDFAGNVQRHGPIDEVKVREPRRGEKQGMLARECPNCRSLVSIAATVCDECGFEFAVADQVEVGSKHEDKPADVEIVAGLSTRNPIERWKVQTVRYSQTQKPNKPATLAVEYLGGFGERVREWVCFDHDVGSYPRRRAEWWWRDRGGKLPPPASVDEARVRIECDELFSVLEVIVDTRGEWPELKGVTLDRDAGLDEHEQKKQQPAIDLSELPF